jgi:cell division septation protein DedD
MKQLTILITFLSLNLTCFAQDKYEKRSNKFIKTLEKDFKLTPRQKEDLKKLHQETAKTIDDVADDFSTGSGKGNGSSTTVDKEVDSAVKDVEKFVEEETSTKPAKKPVTAKKPVSKKPATAKPMESKKPESKKASTPAKKKS